MSMTGINYFSAMMMSLKLAILTDLVHLKNLYHGLDYDINHTSIWKLIVYGKDERW